jgi:hypothetical protein
MQTDEQRSTVTNRTCAIACGRFIAASEQPGATLRAISSMTVVCVLNTRTVVEKSVPFASMVSNAWVSQQQGQQQQWFTNQTQGEQVWTHARTWKRVKPNAASYRPSQSTSGQNRTSAFPPCVNTSDMYRATMTGVGGCRIASSSHTMPVTSLQCSAG